jgi:hypothetical protein
MLHVIALCGQFMLQARNEPRGSRDFVPSSVSL